MEAVNQVEAETSASLSSEQLLPVVYDELRRLAAGSIFRGKAGMTLQPTALVHEAWIRLGARHARNWECREHFFNAAALTMRRILMDRARQKATLRHGGGELDRLPEVLVPEATSPDERLLMMDEGLRHLEGEDPEGARVVMLKFFTGMTNVEIAETLEVNVRTIERKWAHAKVRLYQIVREIQQAEDGLSAH